MRKTPYPPRRFSRLKLRFTQVETMFPDLTCDDVFLIESRRLWLRWPRLADVPAMTRYCSRAEVALMTAGIPHPYPKGSAERFIYASREANAEGRQLNLALTFRGGKRDAIGTIGLAARAQGRLSIGYVLAPEHWGLGLMTEAVAAIVETGFQLTQACEITTNVFLQNATSRRVLEKNGFESTGRNRQGAPARGGLIDCTGHRLPREIWAARRVAVGMESKAS